MICEQTHNIQFNSITKWPQIIRDKIKVIGKLIPSYLRGWKPSHLIEYVIDRNWSVNVKHQKHQDEKMKKQKKIFDVKIIYLD